MQLTILKMFYSITNNLYDREQFIVCTTIASHIKKCGGSYF